MSTENNYEFMDKLPHDTVSPVEKQRKNVEQQQYILSKIKNLQEAKKIAHQELITGLPNWTNDF